MDLDECQLVRNVLVELDLHFPLRDVTRYHHSSYMGECLGISANVDFYIWLESNFPLILFFFFMHFRAFLVVVKAVRIPWVLLVAFAEDQAMFWIQINDRAKVRYVSYCIYTNSLYLFI